MYNLHQIPIYVIDCIKLTTVIQSVNEEYIIKILLHRQEDFSYTELFFVSQNLAHIFCNVGVVD